MKDIWEKSKYCLWAICCRNTRSSRGPLKMCLRAKCGSWAIMWPPL